MPYEIDRENWNASKQFLYDLMLYCQKADYYMENYYTQGLIEMCSVLLTRLGQRIDEKYKNKPLIIKGLDGKEDIKVSVRDALKAAIVDAATTHNWYLKTGSKDFQLQAHTKAKEVYEALNDAIWEMNLILKEKMDPSRAGLQGRSGFQA